MNAVTKSVLSVCGTLALILAGSSMARAEDLLESKAGVSQVIGTEAGTELPGIGSTHEEPSAGEGKEGSEKDWWFRYRYYYHYHYYRPVCYYYTRPVYYYWYTAPVVMFYDGVGGAKDEVTASTDKIAD